MSCHVMWYMVTPIAKYVPHLTPPACVRVCIDPAEMSDREELLREEVAEYAGEVHMTGKTEEVGESEYMSIDKDDNDDDDDGAYYTVEEAVEKMGFGFFQIIITFFSGLLWVADAMELMLLSVLSPAVKCQWGLSSVEEAIITTVVFFGFLIGGLVWGFACDRIGRKWGLLIVNIMILVFGILSAIPVTSNADAKIPNYPWLLLCRFGVGLGSGGVAQSVTYYAEFLPKKFRGICLVVLDVWWAIGSMFGAVLALLVMEPLGWHWFLGLATIPLFLVLPMFLIVPESARYLVVMGKKDKATKVIKRIAWINCRKPPKGKIVTVEEKECLDSSLEESDLEKEQSTSRNDLTTAHWSRNDQISISHSQPSTSDSERIHLLEDTSGNESSASTDLPRREVSKGLSGKLQRFVKVQAQKFYPLFTDRMWLTTVLLVFVWVGCAWLYYGIVLLTTSFLQYDPHCGKTLNETNSSNCTGNQLDRGDYLKILWTTAAELPGILITLIIIEVTGRKLTMAFEFLVSGAIFLLLLICTSDIVLTLFLFLIRAFATGVFQAVYVYTPEVYPTSVRAMALGVHTAFARIGSMVTPFVAQSLLPHSDYATIGLYSGSCFVLVLIAVLLPIETKGRSMKDSGNSD